MRVTYVYIRPSPILAPGRWWVHHQGSDNKGGTLPLGQPAPDPSALYNTARDLLPFPSEEAAWQYARQLAERLAIKHGSQPVEGTCQGTFGTWRAWVVRHD